MTSMSIKATLFLSNLFDKNGVKKAVCDTRVAEVNVFHIKTPNTIGVVTKT